MRAKHSNRPGGHDARRIYRRVTLRIMPLLEIAFVVSVMDRINVGFAHLNMKTDLGFSDAVYGLSAGIFFIGYLLFEVPSNALLQRIGAKKTFTRILLSWGLASVATAFVTQPWMFYSLRFLLGVFEAGFFPGIILYLSYWYPSYLRASITSWIFAAATLAGMVSGLASGSVMTLMNAFAGLHGWQWLFIVEGTPAIVLGVAFLFCLDDGPASAQWLSETDKHFIQSELDNERVSSEIGQPDGESVLTLLKRPPIQALCFVYFALIGASMALNFWVPTLIRDAGGTNLVNIGLLAAIPYAVATVALVLLARYSDARGEPGRYLFVTTLAGCFPLLAIALMPMGITWTVISLTFAVVLTFAPLPLFWAIPHVYLSRESAAKGFALISSVGQLGGFFTPTLIGWMRTRHDGTGLPILIIAAILAAGALMVPVLLRHRGKAQNRAHRVTPGTPVG
ncbi:MFS transporter [Paraburkholderia sediminicola]|uniref:MFS transporter n=1 Tax=Paraburkholderia sediminicola TaxID=458836 RepID=UPI0038BB1C9D